MRLLELCCVLILSNALLDGSGRAWKGPKCMQKKVLGIRHLCLVLIFNAVADDGGAAPGCAMFFVAVEIP